MTWSVVVHGYQLDTENNSSLACVPSQLDADSLQVLLTTLGVTFISVSGSVKGKLDNAFSVAVGGETFSRTVRSIYTNNRQKGEKDEDAEWLLPRKLEEEIERSTRPLFNVPHLLKTTRNNWSHSFSHGYTRKLCVCTGSWVISCTTVFCIRR